ncbi:DNA-binding transcriptional regulator, MocR family, contains an aminotransferase domain [Paramicrobacterium humi]|uniref:DNA-binding transcriptional regulator, MocR family, contains an aminotransferase domain n=1 Tax=Paramicrobacterium humi TaxID=640635 RepID=A0A1H4LW05_9MICO|nr:aminotransferase class I/II-fold pyridoxal phosphate-dependent enzyme [Microbacterium humi]SEB74455.1 DNA-binding transcriptional regulator, MocR family, contains an aminotransferase domain [Microbacterium humi]
MSTKRTDGPHTAEGIFQSLEGDILSGKYRPGDLLPSIRELARERDVSPATAAAAFRRLADRGLTHVVRGVGTTVRQESLLVNSPLGAPDQLFNGAIDVASGAPDPAFLPDLNVHLRRISVEKTLYDVDPMLPELRTHALAQLCDVLAGRPENVMITNGALDGIADASEVRLRAGDRIIVEDPGFAAATSLLRSRGLALVPVPVDDEGFESVPFQAAIRHGAAAVIYSPRAQNPRGSALSAERAAELRAALAAARDKGRDVFVIENDHASLVANADYHSLTVDSSSWLSIRSLSKSHGPDLRFAFAAGDELTIERMQRRQSLNRGWISTILQRLVVDLLSDTDVQHLVSDASVEYGKRRARLIEALSGFGIPAFGCSGLNVMVPVDDEASVSSTLIAGGWQARSGQTYRHTSRPFIRLTSAALDYDKIDQLARHVSQALHGTTRPHR